MSQEHKKYQINKVEDLLLIPEDKIDQCLFDMRSWYEFARHLAPLVEMKLVQYVKFTWVDDGVDGLSAVNIKIDKGGQK